MFPGVSAEENQYNNDLLAWWRSLAERNRRSKQKSNIAETLSDIPSLEDLLKTIAFTTLDTKTGEEIVYKQEKNEHWDVIINHENKSINFIHKESWDIIVKKFL